MGQKDIDMGFQLALTFQLFNHFVKQQPLAYGPQTLEDLQKSSLEAARVAAEAAIKARKASSNQASTSAATPAQDQQGVQSSPFQGIRLS